MKQCKKLVAGVGLNDAGYDVVRFTYEVLTKNGSPTVVWKCPFYNTWVNMLSRAYGTKKRNDSPAYIGVEVVKEWHTFSNFKAWMEQQDWQGKSLDKDILYHGNKVYGPAMCCFVSAAVNTFVTDGRPRRTPSTIGIPTGVQVHGKYIYGTVYHVDNSQRRRVRCNTYDEAHLVWAESKLRAVDDLSERENLEERVYRALIARYTMTVYRARAKVENSGELVSALAA